MADMADGLLSRVSEHTDRGGPAWLEARRADAAQRLRDGGFPGKRHERWRFTSVRSVVDTAFVDIASVDETLVGETGEASHGSVHARVPGDGTWRVLIAGGRPHFGDTSPPDGVTVEPLSAALSRAPATLDGALGSVVKSEQFAALNDALFTDGLVIRVRGGAEVKTPIHVIYSAPRSHTPTATYPRVLFIAEPSSQSTLVESFVESDGAGEARHLTNAVTEVIARDNARVEHVRFTDGTTRSLQLAYLGVKLGRDAFYGGRVVTLGGALSRLDLTVELCGAGAEVELDGAYHAGGRDHVDHHVRVEHRAARCTSRVRYRGLLDGHGHAVFDAIGVVHKDAIGSAAHQENRNLLGSPDALVHTKPHLEIECDDVTASHGATVGTLDTAQLFYLRSRGIPEEEARGILTYAFVREVIDPINHPPLLQRASDAMLARLPNGELLSEGAVS